jgi:hypothetical protein
MQHKDLLTAIIAVERKIRSTKSTINKLLDQHRNSAIEINTQTLEVHELNLQLSFMITQLTEIKKQCK